MATENAAPPPAAPEKKKRNWVPIIIIVGIVVIAIIAAVIYKVTKSDSTAKGKPAGQTAKGLYKAWQTGNQASAAKFANANAVTTIFAVKTTDASGLTFGGCSSTGANAFPKECVWSRPGGELTMTLAKNGNKVQVTKVKYGPAGLPPTSNG
jgi:hypothetical protein